MNAHYLVAEIGIYILCLLIADSSTVEIAGPHQLFLDAQFESPFTLECTGANKVTWLRNGHDVKQITRGGIYNEYQETTISATSHWPIRHRLNVTSHWLSGLYTCRGQDGKESSIFVHGKVKSNVKASSHVYKGSKTDVTCEFKKNISPKRIGGVTWYKDNKKLIFDPKKYEFHTYARNIGNKHNVIEIEVFRLSILNVEQSDAGRYYCVPLYGEQSFADLGVNV